MPGIACAGHWVLDFIKIVDHWPNKCELSNITAQYISNGGAPFNVLVDIVNLDVGIPTYGIGCIGGDDIIAGKILNICKQKNIDTKFLTILKDESSSYTDVMTEEKTGVRTMFHYRGANDKFSPHHVPIKKLNTLDVKLFYFGHLLLMKSMEEKDAKFKIKAAKLLHDLKKAGMETALDIATECANRYQQIVVPCLPYIDHLIINELEAGYVAKINIRIEKNKIDKNNLEIAAKKLFALGVKKNVVIHMPEGSYWMTENHEKLWYPALKIPKEKFKATCGAGDAFCAGTLIGIHENWPIKKTLQLATAASALSITAMDNSSGIKSAKKIFESKDDVFN